MAGDQKEVFFFEKKKQKTFDPCPGGRRSIG
jgi:hypothetical protein